MNVNTVSEQETQSVSPSEAVPGSEREKTARQKKRRVRALRTFLFRTILLALIIYVLFFHIVGIVFMPNKDMYPRMDAGDLLLYYRLERNPKSQDIIVIEKAADSGDKKQSFVCRVIAVPGDTVNISTEKGLAVNGNTLIETGIFYPTEEYEDRIEYPVTLGEGEYFVLADRRNGGMDSRYFGTVTQEEIRGVVITLLRRNNL